MIIILNSHSGIKRPIKKDDLSILAGAKDVFNPRGRTVQNSTVFNFYKHDNYVQNVAYYDVAILEISPPLRFSKTVWPICLPKERNKNRDHWQHLAADLASYGQKTSVTNKAVDPATQQWKLNSKTLENRAGEQTIFF